MTVILTEAHHRKAERETGPKTVHSGAKTPSSIPVIADSWAPPTPVSGTGGEGSSLCDNAKINVAPGAQVVDDAGADGLDHAEVYIDNRIIEV